MLEENVYKKKFRAQLEDTSAYGNVYFLTYHRWAASAKESYFVDKVENFSNLFKQDKIKLFVLFSSLKIFKEVGLHEEIVIVMTCPLLKKLKAKLRFDYYNMTREHVAEAENNIAFFDAKNILVPIPNDIQIALRKISRVVA